MAGPGEVEPILAALPPEGLFLGTFVDTEDEADDLLKKVTRWSARGEQFGRAGSLQPDISDEAGPSALQLGGAGGEQDGDG